MENLQYTPNKYLYTTDEKIAIVLSEVYKLCLPFYSESSISNILDRYYIDNICVDVAKKYDYDIFCDSITNDAQFEIDARIISYIIRELSAYFPFLKPIYDKIYELILESLQTSIFETENNVQSTSFSIDNIIQFLKEAQTSDDNIRKIRDVLKIIVDNFGEYNYKFNAIVTDALTIFNKSNEILNNDSMLDDATRYTQETWNFDDDEVGDYEEINFITIFELLMDSCKSKFQYNLDFLCDQLNKMCPSDFPAFYYTICKMKFDLGYPQFEEWDFYSLMEDLDDRHRRQNN